MRSEWRTSRSNLHRKCLGCSHRVLRRRAKGSRCPHTHHSELRQSDMSSPEWCFDANQHFPRCRSGPRTDQREENGTRDRVHALKLRKDIECDPAQGNFLRETLHNSAIAMTLVSTLRSIPVAPMLNQFLRCSQRITTWEMPPMDFRNASHGRGWRGIRARLEIQTLVAGIPIQL